jgi:exodeoxyribonuclease V alpha subunit
MVRVPDQVPLDAPDVIEGVVDHLLHVGYDEHTVLRLGVTRGDEESVTAVGKVLFGVRPCGPGRVCGCTGYGPAIRAMGGSSRSSGGSRA